MHTVVLAVACLACVGHGRRVQHFGAERVQSSKFGESHQSLKGLDAMRLHSGKFVDGHNPWIVADYSPHSSSLAELAQPDGDGNKGDADGGDAEGEGEGSGDGDDAEKGEEGEEKRERGQKISRMIIIEHVEAPEQKSSGGPGFPPGFPPQGGGGPKPDDDDDKKDEECQCQACCLMRRLRDAQLPQDAQEVASRELKRLRRMPPSHPEYSTLVEYLEWIADLPWTKSSEDRLTISAARDQLEADHFGMEKVKSRILEYLSVCKLKGDLRGSILCLHGPPGIGKTSLGKSIADALHRDFYRVSLGGVHSEAEVRGHRRTYVGAMPGLIVQALKKCGTNNCVVLLDEIDKLGRNSLNGDPSAALLEVLDPEQNGNFRDHFLNLPFNLSRVLFITTANELDSIPRVLRDRMEIIDMSGYTVEEKIQIAKRHLLPKQLKYHGLGESDIEMEVPAIDALISRYTREAGVRELDRQLAALCRSVAARTAQAAEAAAQAAEVEANAAAPDSLAKDATGNQGSGSSTADAANATWTGGVLRAEDLINILGPPKYDGPRDNMNRAWKAGIATGLAYTPVGGDVLFVEAETMGGKGELTITGSLGDVMAESVRIATGWVRAHAEELDIPCPGLLLNGTDLHIHFPAGATPKDGPSAGVTIASAIVSLLTGRQVRRDLAMTGEITLRGLVLPVGGIKEKLVAAHRAGMKHIIIPSKNEKDLRELPPSVLEEMKITLAKDIEDVLAVALLPPHETVDDRPSCDDGVDIDGSVGVHAEAADFSEILG